MPLLDDGSVIPAGIIEEMANKRGIAVRTGCFCNPGKQSHWVFQPFSSENPFFFFSVWGLG